MRANVRGINGIVQIRFKGTVRWSWEDDMGQVHQQNIPDTIFMPTAPERILSPQHWSQVRAALENDRSSHCITDPSSVRLKWDQDKKTKTVPLDPDTNVAILWSAGSLNLQAFNNVISDDEFDTDGGDDSDDSDDSSIDSEGANDSPLNTEAIPQGPRPVTFDQGSNLPNVIPDDTYEVEEEESLLQLYLQWHHRLNHLAFSKMKLLINAGLLPKKLQQVRPPRCAACLIGRATRRPWRTKAKHRQQQVPAVRAAGDCVSVDQLESTTPGLIAQLRGFITKRRYHFSTVFVDHHSKLGFVYLQETSNMVETLQAKNAFESYARSRGVIIKHYHADNGRFADKGWTDDVKKKGQTITFCGVNAHHQNGVAEKRIRDLQEAARTALIHAKKRWPSAIETSLWPFALQNANEVANYTVNLQTGKVPIHEFSQLEPDVVMRHFRTFGCPSYVLDSDLQSGKKHGKFKWSDRAKVSINLGPSPTHGRSVHLLLNIQTGMITPQFHVDFDDAFDTTRAGAHTPLPKCLWQVKTYFKTPFGAPRESPLNTTRVRRQEPARVEPNPVLPSQGEPENIIPDLPPDDTEPQAGGPPHETTPEEPITTRSGREVRRPSRFLESYMNVANYDGTHELIYQDQHPLALFKATSDPDTLYLDQAMQADDKDKFLKAMLKEIRDHEQRHHWKVVPRSKVPEGANILPAVWSMKRKRIISTGEIYKWKSRLNLGGHKQRRGIDHPHNTYAPVVAWPSIRLFLTFIVINRWKTRQMDFILAYPQAEVERETYMEIPQGFGYHSCQAKGQYVLRILRNLYGSRHAGRTWFLFARDYLLKLGFKQSTVDPCVFYLHECILLIYVDDVIIAAPTDEKLDEIIELIKDNVDVEDQGDICDYVGVNFIQHDDGSFELQQPHLIRSVLKDLRLDAESKPATTPALSSVILHADLDGEDHDGHFDYRSVIGKLNYLEKSSRPDIGYATHQCARFVSNPKKSHAKAVKRIGRYLLATQSRGYIIKPDLNRSYECFVDASFAGEWDKHRTQQAITDPNTARSRTGYVIMYAGVPITWGSRLQVEVCLSSCEAEMVALSQATRENIYLLRLMADAKSHGIDMNFSNAKIHCKVLEDNTGTVTIATEPKIRPRTKHLNQKYWHFIQFLRQGLMSISWISTENQLADLLTKPLNDIAFHKFTAAICGWDFDTTQQT